MGARARASARDRARRVRGAASPIAQTTAAAALAWLAATWLLPEARPVFAPLTAIIALGATTGERGARALQVALGVTVGVGIAGLIVRLLGVGTLQLALVTALALAAAVFLSTATTFVVQAAVTGALVVAIGPGSSVAPNRFFEAVVGAAIALAFSQVLFPVDVLGRLRTPAAAALEALARALHCGAVSVTEGDGGDADAARRAMRDAGGRLADLEEAIALARRATRTSPVRHRDAGELRRYRRLADTLDGVLADVRSLLVTVAGRAHGDRAMGEVLERLAVLAERIHADDALSGEELAGVEEAAAAAAAGGGEASVTAAALARSAARQLSELHRPPSSS